MLDYNLDLDASSRWLTTTPSQIAASMPFYISEIGKFDCGGGFFTERTEKDNYLLFYTVAGQGLLETQGAALEMPPCTAVLLDCRFPQRYCTAGEKWNHYWIHLNGQGVAAYYGLINTPRLCTVTVRDNILFTGHLDSLLDSAEQTDVLSLSENCVHLHSLLCALLKDKTELEKGRANSRVMDIMDAAAYIRAHYRETVTVNALVQRFNLSKYYFIRLFRQYMGTTPYDYLLHCRINQAKTLLTTTELSVERIAEAVGFGDVSNFINHFKRLTGSKPTRFRNESLFFGRTEEKAGD